MSALTFAVGDTSTGTASRAVPFGAQSTATSPLRAPASRSIPISISKGQAYYWSHKWQAGERESRSEIEAGRGITFETAEDAIRWLLSDDD